MYIACYFGLKINNHLDKLQEDLLNELTEAVAIVTRQTSELMVSLDEKQKELSEYKTNMALEHVNTCLGLLHHSLFDSRPEMFAGLMHTVLD
jgi:hypothetical protein